MAQPTFGITIQGNLNVTASSIMEIVNDESKKALNASLREGRQVMRREIEESKAVASETLLRSVSSRIDSLALGNWVYQGEIYFKGISDARVRGADTGRGPGGGGGSGGGFYRAILAWTSYKGIDAKYAYPIMRNLIKSGTNVSGWQRFGRKSFLADGTLGIEKVLNTNFDKAAERIARRMQDAHSSTNTS